MESLLCHVIACCCMVGGDCCLALPTHFRPTSDQGLFMPLLQFLWCFGMVGLFGCWGCAAGVAGVGASMQITYRIAQFDANWLPLGVALWSVLFIMASEILFLWQAQMAIRSLVTFLAGLATLLFLYKTVSDVLASATAVGMAMARAVATPLLQHCCKLISFSYSKISISAVEIWKFLLECIGTKWPTALRPLDLNSIGLWWIWFCCTSFDLVPSRAGPRLGSQ